MGLLEKIFPAKAREQTVTEFFKTLNAYTPVFTSRDGGLYEMELTRSAIHAFASSASKLKPEIVGDSLARLKTTLEFQPNPWMDTSKFLYRLATMLEVNTTAFIVPITNELGASVGYFPLLPQRVEIVQFEGEPWLRYTFADGTRAAIEFTRVGILNKFQYADDFFGGGNRALSPTLDLLDVQRQGMAEGVRQGANIRFLMRIAQNMRSEDIKSERDRFSAENLTAENTSGVMMYDNRFSDVKPIESKPFIIDAEQMKLIQTNVYNYFGVNEKILQNSWGEEDWNAWYEGKIEPFALQLGLVLTNMTFTPEQRARGEQIMLSSNRLQYASNTTKLAVTRDLSDRGLLSNFAAADIWNLPRPPGEERWVIRGEYIDLGNLPSHTVDNAKDYLKPAAKKEEE